MGWVGLLVQSFHFDVGWVGLGQSFGGVSWVGLKKLDPRTTLISLLSVRAGVEQSVVLIIRPDNAL